jgi:excisionase family DNA binding protein
VNSGATIQNKLCTVREAAEYLRVHEKTVRRLIKSGSLKAVKFGRNVRIHSDELTRLVASGMSA